MISKIKTVTKTENTWVGQGGTMYDYRVQMEDGTEGIASSKSDVSTPYGTGDEVEYTKTENTYGVKLRIKKVDEDGKTYASKPINNTQKNIENSWAIQTAVQILGVNQDTIEAYLDAVRLLAKTLLNERDNLS